MRRFAWVSDKTRDERARLRTITPKLWCIEGDEQRIRSPNKTHTHTTPDPLSFISLLDTPGHHSCALMSIASMCMADAALVVVSAQRGGFEEGIASDGSCP